MTSRREGSLRRRRGQSRPRKTRYKYHRLRSCTRVSSSRPPRSVAPPNNPNPRAGANLYEVHHAGPRSEISACWFSCGGRTSNAGSPDTYNHTEVTPLSESHERKINAIEESTWKVHKTTQSTSSCFSSYFALCGVQIQLAVHPEKTV